MDDIYLNFNQKGRKIGRIIFDYKQRGINKQKTNIMVMSDRYGTLDMKVTTLGRMSVEDLERVIDESRLNDDNIICSDSHRSITSYISELGLKHKTIDVNKGEHVVEGIYHVQKVNSLTREFKDWLKLNFNNVSTKYLHQLTHLISHQSTIKSFREESVIQSNNQQGGYVIGYQINPLDKIVELYEKIEKLNEEIYKSRYVLTIIVS